MMGSHNPLFSLLSLSLFLLLSGQRVQQAEARQQRHELNSRPKKLFVFGDSYLDAGNHRKGDASSWKDPYGITFPGKPVGRYSDGRVFSDFVAKYLGLKSPASYRWRKLMPERLKYGMNFAVGGTGVFDTSIVGPNMTTQIHFLQQLIKDKVYNAWDLSNSVALVSVAGNDYIHYMETNGSAKGLPSFIVSVVNQTTTNLIRLRALGVKKIAVDGLQPLGCLPYVTVASSFQHCDDAFNNLTQLHNNLLNQAVTRLNQQTKDHSSFLILNLYDSFMSVLNSPSAHNLQNRLQPCCVGVSREYLCGSVDQNNVKKYNLCDDPSSAFFWDRVHLTQAGWHAVYKQLRTTSALQQLQY